MIYKNFEENDQRIGPTVHLMALLDIFGVQSMLVTEMLGTNMDLLLKWLKTPMENGQPKMLTIGFGYEFYGMALINRIKEVCILFRSVNFPLIWAWFLIIKTI